MTTKILSLALVLSLVSCGGGDAAETGPSAGSSEAAGMPAALWSDTPLEGAKDVRVAREENADGDDVVLRGTLSYFGELATFSLVEDSLKDCTEMGPDDHCKEPWDYCCEDPDKLKELTVNVEFLEGDLPGEWTLKGEHGLDHLSEVAVAGTLRVDEAGNLRLEAKKMSMQ